MRAPESYSVNSVNSVTRTERASVHPPIRRLDASDTVDTVDTVKVDAGACLILLDEWRAGLTALRYHPAPPGFVERVWEEFKQDAFRLFAMHGSRLAALGWTSNALFGLHPTVPAVRMDTSGLARFMHGGKIIDLSAQSARLRCRTGAVLTFHRSPAEAGAVPAWRFHQPPPKENEAMPDYSMDLDTGAIESGPFLSWHAAATKDGSFLPGCWTVKDAAGRVKVDLTQGFAFDWPNCVTGWIQAIGVPGLVPQKKWNASRAKFEPQPGPDFRKGMHAQIGYLLNGAVSRAVWEQNSIASWLGFVDLMKLLKDVGPSNLPNLPVVCHVGHYAVRVGNNTTLVPKFEIRQWRPRPECLPDGSGPPPSSPTGGAPAAPTQPPPPSSPPQTGNAWDMAMPSTAGGSTALGPLIDDEIPW